MEIGLDSLSKVERMSEGIDDQQSYDIVKSAIVMVMIVNPILTLNCRVNSFTNLVCL